MLDHYRQHQLGRVPVGGQAHVERALPFLQRNIGDAREGRVHRVVKQHVDPPVLVGGALHHPLEVGGLRDVYDYIIGVAARAADFLDHAAGARLVAVGDCDDGTLAGESFGGGFADPGGAAGD